MNYFFTSDQHFGSERTLELSKRPFKSTDEMNQVIINRFNSKVTNDDIVIHLGDFGDFNKVKELNGKYHYLIMGNYEQKEMEEKFNNNFEEYSKYIESFGFSYLQPFYGMTLDFSDILGYDVGSPFVVDLHHCPEDCERYEFNLFGHIHGRQLVKRYGLDVGVDGHHFYPVSIKDVEFYKTAIEKYYDDNVFE